MPVEIETRAFEAGVAKEVADLISRSDQEVWLTAKDVENRAKALAPVLTGELRDSIQARKTADGAEVTVGTDHGFYTEFGTSDTPTQPFLRPAVQEAAGKFGRRLSQG